MNSDFLITSFLPVVAGLIYFLMAFEVRRTGKVRALMFGEIGFKKTQTAFIMFGIYFITRPLQNFLGPHPMPLIINCIRQFFLMAVIAPSILVAIFHWVPTPSGAPKSSTFAAYVTGFLIGIIFVLTNTLAVSGSKLIYSWGIINMYDPVWFASGAPVVQLVMIHLICQFVSPVGFLLLAAAYVKHRRHNYQMAHIYNLIPLKWKYLELSMVIFAASFIAAGAAVVFGSYYTYVWVIYFIGAIISGIVELRGIKLPPRDVPHDLK
ncbi:MAG: hypothetical protein LBQ47_04995 [Endomicrobium sp.]|jgi:hypothetical protein|nr:hypothetical protein [Endomicrobium sp.]